MEQKEAIVLADVTVAYQSTTVLNGLDLHVAQGEVYALLGGNGAGKSTTINTLLGFVQPLSGSVKVCGTDVTADARKARASLAYVPENVALYEHLSARENMGYFLRLAGGDDSEASISSALELAGLPRVAWERRLGGYSKGMRQKVAIALALARSVPVLLLDEPTTGLDPQATSEFNALLHDLRGQKVTVLMVTHDLLGAAAVADRIGFLGGGRIAEEFSAAGDGRFDVQRLYQHYAHGGRAA